MEEQIKNIIIEKQYFELTEREKQLIGEWARNEEEFHALKLTFLTTVDLKNNQEKQLSSSIKESLNKKFVAKHTHQKVKWLNRWGLFFFPKDTQFFKKPAFQLVMVALIIGLIIPFIWQSSQPQYVANHSGNNLVIDSLIIKEELKTQEKHQEETDSEKNIANTLNDKSNNEISEKSSKRDQSKQQIRAGGGEVQRKENTSNPEIQTESNRLQEVMEKEMANKAEKDVGEGGSKKTKSQENIYTDNIEINKKTNMKTPADYLTSKSVESSETLGLLTVLY